MGGTSEVQKLAWVKWSSVRKSREEGGLGIRSVGLFNKALVGIWGWRFLTESEYLWVRVLKAKYCFPFFGVLDIVLGIGSTWWEDVRRVCQVGEERRGHGLGIIWSGRWGMGLPQGPGTESGYGINASGRFS